MPSESSACASGGARPALTLTLAVAVLSLLPPAAPARADGFAGAGIERVRPARGLPPETRYRDHRPPPRVRAFGPPPVLIQAYVPRYTERPMYNEPPSRFPTR